MSEQKPYVLSIAGFDPSAGAGILADIKTIEQNHAYGFGVVSAITYQTESIFLGVRWLEEGEITAQLKLLLETYKIETIKIGLIRDINLLNRLIILIKSIDPEIKIIWDPIIRASAGFVFHETFSKTTLQEVLNNLYLITPNTEEAEFLFNTSVIEEIQQFIVQHNGCSVLLKGGHLSGIQCDDVLITNKEITIFRGERIAGKSKHGTGCVLSAAISAKIACNADLVDACKSAKNYIENFISSNDSLLGYHFTKA